MNKTRPPSNGESAPTPPPLPVLPLHEEDHAHHVPVLSAAGTGKRVAIAATLLVLGLAAVFAYGLITRHRDAAKLADETRAAALQPPAVEVVHVRRSSPSTLLNLPGEVKAFHETTLYARTSGYLDDWYVDIGDEVKVGKTMALIATPELDDQLTASEAKVKQMESEIQLAKANVEFAQQSFSRWEAAVPEGAVSKQDRDQKEAELKTSKAKFTAAEAARDLAKADLQRYQTMAKFKEVKAPFEGIVTQRHIDQGDLITAGSTSNTTAMFTIAQSKKVRVFVDVPQAASREIHNEMTATVTEHDSGRHFIGAVSRTADAMDPVSRTLRVEVIVDNPNRELKPGMYVDVSFKTDRAAPPLEIPAAALAMRTDGPHAAVVSPDGKVTYQRIEIARDMGDVIEVSSGLKEGDMVAMNISTDVSDGDRVVLHAADGPFTPTSKPGEHPAARPGVAAATTMPAAVAARVDEERPTPPTH